MFFAISPNAWLIHRKFEKKIKFCDDKSISMISVYVVLCQHFMKIANMETKLQYAKVEHFV